MNFPSITAPRSPEHNIATPHAFRCTWRRRIGLGIVLSGSLIMGAHAIDAIGINRPAPTTLSSSTK